MGNARPVVTSVVLRLNFVTANFEYYRMMVPLIMSSNLFQYGVKFQPEFGQVCSFLAIHFLYLSGVFKIWWQLFKYIYFVLVVTFSVVVGTLASKNKQTQTDMGGSREGEGQTICPCKQKQTAVFTIKG